MLILLGFVPDLYYDYVMDNLIVFDQKTQIHQIQWILGSIEISGNTKIYNDVSLLYSVYSSISINQIEMFNMALEISPILITESTVSITSITAWNISSIEDEIAIAGISYSAITVSSMNLTNSNSMLLYTLYSTGSVSNLFASKLKNFTLLEL